MSTEITLQKNITLQDIEDKTNITVEYNKEHHEYSLTLGHASVSVWCYTKTVEEMFKMKEEGYSFITDENGNIFSISKEGKKESFSLDKGLLNQVVTISGRGSLGKIMNEIVSKLQTQFITDEEEIAFYHDKENKLDVDTVFRETTIRNGFNIDENGVITINNDIPIEEPITKEMIIEAEKRRQTMSSAASLFNVPILKNDII